MGKSLSTYVANLEANYDVILGITVEHIAVSVSVFHRHIPNITVCSSQNMSISTCMLFLFSSSTLHFIFLYIMF